MSPRPILRPELCDLRDLRRGRRALTALTALFAAALSWGLGVDLGLLPAVSLPVFGLRAWALLTAAGCLSVASLYAVEVVLIERMHTDMGRFLSSR